MIVSARNAARRLGMTYGAFGQAYLRHPIPNTQRIGNRIWFELAELEPWAAQLPGRCRGVSPWDGRRRQPPPPGMVDVHGLAELLGVTVSTVHVWRRRYGRVPPPDARGWKGCLLWTEETAKATVEANRS